MLSGIKTGKRKRRPPAPPQQSSNDAEARKQPPLSSSSSAAAAKGSGSSDNNKSAADVLRMSLLGGTSVGAADNNNDDVQSKLNSRASSYKNNESTIHNLQSRGRISNSTTTSKQTQEEDIIVINNHPAGSSSSKSIIEYEREHNIRYNSRGKLSNHAHTQLRQKTESEMTIEEMAAQEKHNTNNNMDEVYARNVVKMGKSYNKLDAIMGKVDKSGVDEEDYGQETNLLSNLYTSNDDKLSSTKLATKLQSKQIAQHNAITKITNKSWYWLESSKFDKRYLIALGDKVSLVMTPSHKRLQQQHAHSSTTKKNVWNGGQCYIVPLSYAESFVSLDEDTWTEVQKFQTSLKQMFHKDGRGVLFLETVSRTSGNKGMGYQAKMEVVPVPTSVERDAPLYFKSALAEVAQEWGTHGLKPIVLGGQSKKSLRSAVPKVGFPYFYCGWSGGIGGGGGNNIIDEGFVQLIENEDDGDDYGDDNNDGGFGGGGGMRAGGGSKKFPRDFGLDTIGGMMDCDPMRFQRKNPSNDGDRAEILQFCERWKEFDWTLELDG